VQTTLEKWCLTKSLQFSKETSLDVHSFFWSTLRTRKKSLISATIRNNNRQQLKQKHKLRTRKINHLHPTPQNKSKSSFYPRLKPAPSSCTDLSAIPDTVVPWEFPSWLHRCEALSLDRWSSNNLRFNPIGSMYGIFAYTFSTIKINHSCGEIYHSHGSYGNQHIHDSDIIQQLYKKQTEPIRDIKTVYHSTCHQSRGPAYPRPLPANLAITWSAFGRDAAGTWQTWRRLHDTCTVHKTLLRTSGKKSQDLKLKLSRNITHHIYLLLRLVEMLYLPNPNKVSFWVWKSSWTLPRRYRPIKVIDKLFLLIVQPQK